MFLTQCHSINDCQRYVEGVLNDMILFDLDSEKASRLIGDLFLHHMMLTIEKTTIYLSKNDKDMPVQENLFGEVVEATQSYLKKKDSAMNIEFGISEIESVLREMVKHGHKRIDDKLYTKDEANSRYARLSQVSRHLKVLKSLSITHI